MGAPPGPHPDKNGSPHPSGVGIFVLLLPPGLAPSPPAASPHSSPRSVALVFRLVITGCFSRSRCRAAGEADAQAGELRLELFVRCQGEAQNAAGRRGHQGG